VIENGTEIGHRFRFGFFHHLFDRVVYHTQVKLVLFGIPCSQIAVGFGDANNLNVIAFGAIQNAVYMGMGKSYHAHPEGLGIVLGSQAEQHLSQKKNGAECFDFHIWRVFFAAKTAFMKWGKNKCFIFL
jgi:hypothetical protein